MHVLHLSDITVPVERQRKEFKQDSIEALAESIRQFGLLHPIVLDNDRRTLRAGERRYRAMCLLADREISFHCNNTPIPVGHVPCTLLSEMPPELLFEVELEENVQRVDLTWQERASALAQLHELHARRAAREGRDMSVREFAQTIAGPGTPTAYLESKTALATAIAKHLDDPEVAKAKSQKEAVNIIRRKQQDILQQALSVKLLEQGFGDSVKSPHTCVNGSLFDLFANVPPASIDLIVTDPPYGIDMNTMNTQSGSVSGLTHDYDDTVDYASACITEIAREGYRVTKASAVCYMFCDLRLWSRWADVFDEAGWYVWPHPIIWNKSPTGMLLGAANGPRHCYEAVLMAIKGNKPINKVGSDVISIPGPVADKRHPAEKPVDLYAQLLSWSATPGDTILDPCCGCGPIFPAATQFQCTAIGWELNPAHFATAMLRTTSSEVL